MQLRVQIKPREKGETRSRANTYEIALICCQCSVFRYLLTGVCQFQVTQ